MPYNKVTISLLNIKKVKITAIRVLVLKAFIQNKYAMSLQNLEDLLHFSDRTSIYRTLKTFTKKGLLHLINDGTRINKYALCRQSCTPNYHQDEHPHFYCEICSSTSCLENLSNPSIKLNNDYTIRTTELIVKGVCQFCNQVA